MNTLPTYSREQAFTNAQDAADEDGKTRYVHYTRGKLVTLYFIEEYPPRHGNYTTVAPRVRP